MRWIFSVAAALALAVPGAVAAGGDVERGREAALEWCSRCHAVGQAGSYGGIDSTPWFRTFAARPEVYPPARIRSFRERPPHPPQNIDISGPELDDLIAYIASLAAD